MTYEYYINGELKSTQSETTYTGSITLNNKAPYIPSGFTHTEGTVDTGYVIKDNTLGNEFVWIPVASGTFEVYVNGKTSSGKTVKSNTLTIGISELTRTLKSTGLEYTEWEETEGSISDKKSIAYFKDSVVKNSGFYMGRYEMGMPGQKSGDDPVLALSNEARNITGVPVCVANVMPWTNIDWSTAKANLESMYNGEVQSAMLNSYARTTMMNWVSGGSGGNYEDTFWPGGTQKLYFKGNWVVTNNSSEIWEGNQTTYVSGEEFLGGAPSGESILLETGSYVKDGETGEEFRFGANNIFDILGNAGEWSTEIHKGSIDRRISGGSFENTEAAYSIDGNMSMYRCGTTGYISTSSRPILYK